MNLLKNKNLHPKDKQISLNEENHTYNINGETDFCSVTTFVHKNFPEFNAEEIINNMMRGKNWKNSTYYGKTKNQIKNLWEENRRQAAEDGTKLHLDIEKFYNNEKVDNKSVEFKQFLDFYKENNNLIPYRTEWLVFDKKLKIAGSIDMVFENQDGTLEIRDWKRSKQIFKNKPFESYSKTKCINHIPNLNYWHYSLQLNIYKYILEKNYNKRVKNLYLVVFHPSKQNYEEILVPELNFEIEELFNLRKLEMKKLKNNNKK